MAVASFANSIVPAVDLHHASFAGCGLKQIRQSVPLSSNSSLSSKHLRQLKLATYKKGYGVQAAYSGGGGRSNSASNFIGGFILGGVIVGTLGFVFAPQISKALIGTDRKDLMRKLPKFIYDEEKALEKTRKVLAEKIAQLNSAIDDVSSQLRTDDHSNGAAAAAADELEAAI